MSPKPSPRKKKSGTRKKKSGMSAGRRLLRALLLVVLLGVVGAGAGLAWLWPRCSGPE